MDENYIYEEFELYGLSEDEQAEIFEGYDD